MFDLTALRAEAATLFSSTETIIDRAAAENRELTEAERTETDTKFGRLNTIRGIEDQQNRLAGLAFARGAAQKLAGGPPGAAAAAAAGDVAGNTVELDFSTPETRKAFRAALNNWARTGVMESRFATITSATATSALLPKDVLPPRVATAPSTIRQALALVGAEAVHTSGTEDISLPIVNPAGGGVVAENALAETENAPDLSASVLLHCQTFQSGTAWFSNLVINANTFDLLTAMLPCLDYSVELAIESFVMAQIATDVKIVQRVSTATVAGMTYNNMVDLNRVLPKRYAFQQVIILSKAAFIAMEKLTDQVGRPILNVDAQNQSLKRFNGTPVLFTDLLPNGGNFGANNVIGFIVSMVGFYLRDADGGGVQKYPPLPGRPNQTGFNEFQYHAVGYDVSAVALLVCPAQ